MGFALAKPESEGQCESHAIRKAELLDTDGLPEGLKSRRAQVHIDTAWAYSQHREDAAVVINLLEAERLAPQALRYLGDEASKEWLSG